MLSKARQLLSRSPGRHGLAGGGLFDRMRATTFALLGGTAAFCLVLVALLSQQGVPYLPALPIPGASGGDEAISNGSAVARSGDSVNVRIPAPAGVPAGPDRLPTVVNTGADSPGSNSDPAPAGPRQVASDPPGSNSPADNGSGGGQPGTGTSSPQSTPVANPAPGGSNGSPGSQSGSGNAEADAINVAGSGNVAKPPKPGNTPPPTAATTAAQQAAAPPASAPPAPAPGSPSAAEEAAAEDAAASP